MADFTVMLAKSSKKSLCEIIATHDLKQWPKTATCVSQESDGLLIWWKATPERVQQAREQASVEIGLMPIVGVGNIVHMHYYIEGKRRDTRVATDWQTAVITKQNVIDSNRK